MQGSQDGGSCNVGNLLECSGVGNRLYHELAKVVQSADKIFELLYLENFVDS